VDSIAPRRSIPPHVVVLAGPNGAGKTTSAPELLHGAFGVDAYVNADVIAAGLSGFRPDAAAIEAGRIMLAHMAHLAVRRISFAFETTLSGRTVATQLARLREIGYDTRLIYLWLPSADIAVARVRRRVELGGHSVPEDVIRRRYRASVRNLRTLYLPLMSTWRVYYNSDRPNRTQFVAWGQGPTVQRIVLPTIWRRIVEDDT
jgi:predicted ABC-type ATPase